jgi:hypothetical protein
LFAVGSDEQSGECCARTLAPADHIRLTLPRRCGRLHRDRIGLFDAAVGGLEQKIAAGAAPYQGEMGLLKTVPGLRGRDDAGVAGGDRPGPA